MHLGCPACACFVVHDADLRSPDAPESGLPTQNFSAAQRRVGRVTLIQGWSQGIFMMYLKVLPSFV